MGPFRSGHGGRAGPDTCRAARRIPPSTRWYKLCRERVTGCLLSLWEEARASGYGSAGPQVICRRVLRSGAGAAARGAAVVAGATQQHRLGSRNVLDEGDVEIERVDGRDLVRVGLRQQLDAALDGRCGHV